MPTGDRPMRFDDKDDDTEAPDALMGRASVSSSDDESPAATFWLPDPVSPSGWSMRHVWRAADEPRPVGFRRR